MRLNLSEKLARLGIVGLLVGGSSLAMACGDANDEAGSTGHSNGGNAKASSGGNDASSANSGGSTSSPGVTRAGGLAAALSSNGTSSAPSPAPAKVNIVGSTWPGGVKPPYLNDIDAGWVKPGRTTGTVDRRIQFPRPTTGARIVMMANAGGYHSAYKYYAPDALKRTMWEFYLIGINGDAPRLGEDPDHHVMYLDNPLVKGGTDYRVLETWDFTWNTKTNTRVIYDMTCAGGAPLNHGTWNTPITQTGWSLVGQSIGSVNGGPCNAVAPFNIQIQRIMNNFPTHIGTMQGVTLNVEDQGPAYRYIFYWATNYGVIGVQGLTDAFERHETLMQAWKTCDVRSDVFICP
jgi:hypothetical protein